MKNTIKTIKNAPYKALLLVVLVFGCSDFLEQEPGSQTSITQQLSTKQGVLEALNGAYVSLEAHVRGERFAVYADLQGGNLTFSPTITGSNAGKITTPINIENVYAFEDLAIESNFDSFYNESYDIINQANLILEYVDALPNTTPEEKNQITAECLTIRGFTHYILALLYSQNYTFTTDASHPGIVYNTSTLSNGIAYPKRETAKNTYNYIIDDITNALDLYTNNSALAGVNYSFFNKINTEALLARIYLTTNNWDSAYNAANNVINSAGVNLTSTDNYITEWEDPNNAISEILLELSIPRDEEDTIGGSLAQHFGFFSNSDYEKYVASTDLMALFDESDIRKNLFLEQHLPTFVINDFEDAPYYFTKKFQDNPGYPVLRLSEMYLVRAEASLNLNNLDDAKNDINVIKQRANIELLTTNNNLEDHLLQERRKEFCFEGHLFFDLARLHKDVVRNNDCISNTCNLNYPSAKYILPIPQDNINLNSNLQQNESY